MIACYLAVYREPGYRYERGTMPSIIYFGSPRHHRERGFFRHGYLILSRRRDKEAPHHVPLLDSPLRCGVIVHGGRARVRGPLVELRAPVCGRTIVTVQHWSLSAARLLQRTALSRPRQ